MFTTFFKQTVAKALLVIALLVGTMAAGTVPAAGQTSGRKQFALSPDARKTLTDLLSGVPPAAQPLVLNALESLGSDQAEAKLSQFAQFDKTSPGVVRKVGPAIIVPGLQLVPPQRRQAFINGVFGVSQPEEQFATQILMILVRAQQAEWPYRITRPEPLRAPLQGISMPD